MPAGYCDRCHGYRSAGLTGGLCESCRQLDGQTSILDELEGRPPLARRTDPQPSHDAAAAVADSVSEARARMLAAFAQLGRATTVQAGKHAGLHDGEANSYTRRTTELARAGLIAAARDDNGDPIRWPNRPGGPPATVWELTDAGWIAHRALGR